MKNLRRLLHLFYDWYQMKNIVSLPTRLPALCFYYIEKEEDLRLLATRHGYKEWDDTKKAPFKREWFSIYGDEVDFRDHYFEYTIGDWIAWVEGKTNKTIRIVDNRTRLLSDDSMRKAAEHFGILLEDQPTLF